VTPAVTWVRPASPAATAAHEAGCSPSGLTARRPARHLHGLSRSLPETASMRNACMV
jgi:hypothetical protein